MTDASPSQLVNVIDLECTCWRQGEPAGEQEVIEIGVTVLDVRTRSLVSTESILVVPTTSEISPFCTELTTLTTEMVRAEGIAFRDALAKLKKTYDAKNRVFASWGDFDRKHFDRQTTREGLASPFGPRHLNVKSLFALQHALARECGMDDALARLGLPLVGTHHRGGDDSRNIATILARMLGPLPTANG
jgi:inhibitor of KinA sporulation pathway (predicted exonuclease)